eukprot:GHRQ01019097.1.p1 GENE.GHRQ01019097.1~~GHRQ01019097.1.p1  ORF type:complete len:142 (+),score=25.95 GHRQ01019097.1:338-763(+)
MSCGAAEDVDSICSCPICVETIQDAFVTPCGHTFCYKCISTHLKNKSNCPSCGAHLVQDHIHPNFLLSKVWAATAAGSRHTDFPVAVVFVSFSSRRRFAVQLSHDARLMLADTQPGSTSCSFGSVGCSAHCTHVWCNEVLD